MNTQEDHLKVIVRNSEARFLDYKKLLENTFKDKSAFSESEWYKDILREAKNFEETYLKKVRQEITDLRQNINPEYFYPARMQ